MKSERGIIERRVGKLKEKMEGEENEVRRILKRESWDEEEETEKEERRDAAKT
jgi:hypothetical protein